MRCNLLRSEHPKNVRLHHWEDSAPLELNKNRTGETPVLLMLWQGQCPHPKEARRLDRKLGSAVPASGVAGRLSPTLGERSRRST